MLPSLYYLRDGKRKRKRQKTRTTNIPTLLRPSHHLPPPPPVSEFRICLMLSEIRGTKDLQWVKLDIIPQLNNLYPLLLQPSPGSSSASPFPYIRHTHSAAADPCRFTTNSIGPESLYSSTLPSLCCSAAIGSTIYGVGGDQDIEGIGSIYAEMCSATSCRETNPVQDRDNVSHCLRYCNLNYGYNWSIGARLKSPRLTPKILVVGGKLFLFGSNCPPLPGEENDVPFAEVYDPALGICSALKNPNPETSSFRRVSARFLITFPLLSRDNEEKILLICRRARNDFEVIYDIRTDSWECFVDAKLDDHVYYIIGEAVAVAKEDSVYWLEEKRRHATIVAYNWKTKNLWQGPIIGLNNEMNFVNVNKESSFHLLHLFDNLFCLIWEEFSHMDSPQPYTKFHITILQVVKDVPAGSLVALVVACYCSTCFNFLSINKPHLLYFGGEEQG